MESVAEDNARAVTLMADGDCDYLTEDVPTILGRPARTFEQFATDPDAFGEGIAFLHGDDTRALVDAMTPFIGSAEVLSQGHLAAQVREAGTTIGAHTASAASMLTWPGVTATRAFVPARQVPKQARKGTTVGNVVITMGTQKVEVPVHLD